MTALFFFWIPVAAIVYSYMLYPVLLRILAAGKQPNQDVYSKISHLPPVAVLMAVHNEQEVLKDKIYSVVNSDFPREKLRLLIGSDASTDNTNNILRELSATMDCVSCFFYRERRGKAAIINEMAGIAREDILIITDANAMFEKDLIFQLIKHFRNEEIGLVDSNMVQKGLRSSGISLPENAYISREVRIKYHESLVWGIMMGPFGGCYAIRKKLYYNVPDLFLVDDFFISMKVLTGRYKVITEPRAIVYEDVSSSLAEEFKRKVRIAAGNFQNLGYFFSHVFSGIPGFAQSFLSHKVLRWLGPFFIVSAFLSSLWLGVENSFYRYLLLIQISILGIPLIDYLLGKIKTHVLILRFITHFISMNFALLVGFFKYIKGIKSNVWQPTRRNQ